MAGQYGFHDMGPKHILPRGHPPRWQAIEDFNDAAGPELEPDKASEGRVIRLR